MVIWRDLLGALMLLAALLVVPKLGVTTTGALIIAGQLAAALVIDNFGWLGIRSMSSAFLACWALSVCSPASY